MKTRIIIAAILTILIVVFMSGVGWGHEDGIDHSIPEPSCAEKRLELDIATRFWDKNLINADVYLPYVNALDNCPRPKAEKVCRWEVDFMISHGTRQIPTIKPGWEPFGIEKSDYDLPVIWIWLKRCKK